MKKHMQKLSLTLLPARLYLPDRLRWGLRCQTYFKPLSK